MKAIAENQESFVQVKQAISLMGLELWCRIFVDRGGHL